jgi:transcription elongation GreA/GreB family factor
MIGLPTKQELKSELLEQLAEGLRVLERAHRASREGATHEEAKPENDKDTRALEQSYLARGQAMRVEEQTAGVAEVQAMAIRTFRKSDPVALGALVTVSEEDTEKTYFVAPQGGGTPLAGGRVQVITPRSPVGRALLGKRVGDVCELKVGGATRELEVIAIE